MRRDVAAGGAVIIVVGLLLVVGVMAVVLWGVLGTGEGDEWVPTVELDLYRNDAQEVYRADIDLEVDDATFIDYLFTGSVAGDSGLPEGDHELEIKIYQGEANKDTGRLLSHLELDVGVPEERESHYTIDMPLAKIAGSPTVVHLWGHVLWDGKELRVQHWVVNPDELTVEGA